MDAEYKHAFSAHLSSLPPEEQEAFKLAGIDGPLVSYRGSGCPGGDIAESSLANHTPDIADLIDGKTVESADAETSYTTDGICEVLSYIRSQPRPGLTIDCLALVFNLPIYGGESMTDLATRHGVCKAAVSKRCVKITKDLKIQPSRAMRSEKTREACRRAQIKKKKNSGS